MDENIDNEADRGGEADGEVYGGILDDPNNEIVRNVFEESDELSDEENADILDNFYNFLSEDMINTNQSDSDSDDVPIDSGHREVYAFDLELPSAHSYLGNLEHLPGVIYLETGTFYKLRIFYHASVIYPGEQIPMVLPSYIFESTSFSTEDSEDSGYLFGLVFPQSSNSSKIYGVTCHVKEKGLVGNYIKIKCKTCQRFVIERKYNEKDFAELKCNRMHSGQNEASVQILPEIVLDHPLQNIGHNSLSKFRQNISLTRKLQLFESNSTAWPFFVYEKYNLTYIKKRLRQYFEAMKCLDIDTMPDDPVMLSFWCGKNILFNTNDRIKIFLMDSSISRMVFIDKFLDRALCFVCKRCNSRIAHYSSLFAMSKEGLQSNFCNQYGYIHETNTIYKPIKDALSVGEYPSKEFSWFPGYSWQIAYCNNCECHVGWKFVAHQEQLTPKWFYALSGSSVIVENINDKTKRNPSTENETMDDFDEL